MIVIGAIAGVIVIVAVFVAFIPKNGGLSGLDKDVGNVRRGDDASDSNGCGK